MLGPIVRLAIRVLAATLSLALRLQCATWRIEQRDIDQLDSALASADRALVTFWHGQYFPLFPMMRGRRICVFASRSFRGRVIAAICERFGYRCVLVPRRSHDEALELMRTVMRTATRCATAADGPHGPPHRFKPDLVRLASELDFTIVPLWVSATPSYTAERRWDRRETPRPFARIRLRVGGPIVLPSNLDPKAAESWCRLLEQETNSLAAVRAPGRGTD
jgi:lysophospholipid acyltransferase (LPLAT)-like uncharacterized protein